MTVDVTPVGSPFDLGRVPGTQGCEDRESTRWAAIS